MYRNLFIAIFLLLLGGMSTSRAAQSDNAITNAKLKEFLTQMGVKVDPAANQGNFIITKVADKNEGEITIVVAHDPVKYKLGLFAYNFGNVGQARNEVTVLRRLLDANNNVAIGGFFVDDEKEIGFKYYFGSVRNIDFEEFNTIYFAMLNAIKKYKPEIKEALIS